VTTGKAGGSNPLSSTKSLSQFHIGGEDQKN
jgi:hypothetical protein